METREEDVLKNNADRGRVAWTHSFILLFQKTTKCLL